MAMFRPYKIPSATAFILPGQAEPQEFGAMYFLQARTFAIFQSQFQDAMYCAGGRLDTVQLGDFQDKLDRWIQCTKEVCTMILLVHETLY
jgi:hypothetical protein